MSDDFFGDEYDDYSEQQDERPQGGNGLRQFAESQKKRADELEQRLRELETGAKRDKLADALKASGVSNPDALGEFGDLIAPEKAGDFINAVKAAMGLEVANSEAQGVSQEDAAAVAAVSGEPAGTTPTTQGESLSNISAIDNEADFWAAIRSQ